MKKLLALVLALVIALGLSVTVTAAPSINFDLRQPTAAQLIYPKGPAADPEGATLGSAVATYDFAAFAESIGTLDSPDESYAGPAYALRKVDLTRWGDETLRFSEFRYVAKNGFVVDLVYNAVADKTFLTLSEKNVIAIVEVDLKTARESDLIVTDESVGLVATDELVQATAGAVVAGDLNRGLKVLVAENLSFDLLIFDELTPTAIDVAFAKG